MSWAPAFRVGGHDDGGGFATHIMDERHDNARLNAGDYVLVVLSNDASEFGLRFVKEF